ncbi:uncharacterized protein V6R79_021207 [Siganus canaliculatus]
MASARPSQEIRGERSETCCSDHQEVEEEEEEASSSFTSSSSSSSSFTTRALETDHQTKSHPAARTVIDLLPVSGGQFSGITHCSHDAAEVKNIDLHT